MVVIGAIISVHKLEKDIGSHKKAIGENKSLLVHNPNIELTTYILKAKKEGFAEEQIIHKLKENNWKTEEIKKHMNSLFQK